MLGFIVLGCVSILFIVYILRINRRVILNERILSSLFTEFIRLKYDYNKTISKEELKTKEDENSLFEGCKHSIYQSIMENIEEQTGYQGIKKEIDILYNGVNKSRILWLIDFVRFCYSKIDETNKSASSA
jgi:hypothetical protein